MKRLLFVILIIPCLVFTSRGQNNFGISDSHAVPDSSAMMDVYSTTKGVLIPRVALTSSTSATPISNPATSLLVYNTATISDVTPGYYYWNGASKWARLVARTDPEKIFNTVTKLSNATLLKTENMVFASEDITLTLPIVISTDDGLQITIKNVGSYMDLITVVPQAGKSIDANPSSILTRWRGRTYIAKGTNWIIKEKETRADNLLDVSTSGSFTTIAEVVEFLNAHMSAPTIVRLGGGSYTIAATQTINLPYPVTFEGLSFGETSIDAAAGVSGNPLFICQTECYFKKITFNSISNTSGNDGIRFTNSGTYHEIKDCQFNNFNKGIVSTNNHSLIWVFEVAFMNCAGAGIEIADGAAGGGSLKVSEGLFMQCAKGISLLSGVSETVTICNTSFFNTTSGTDIGILYTPATFASVISMFISSNTWNNQGTFISGFDFSLSSGRDANVYMINNSGIENENPHCKMNVNNNAATTTVTTAGTYYKANWTNTSVYTTKWTMGNNRITYQPVNVGDAWAIITGNIAVNNTNRVITIAIVKNGVTATRYGETDLRITVANQPFQFSTVIYIPDLAQTDYLELFCTAANNGDVVTFRDIQWFTNTQ